MPLRRFAAALSTAALIALLGGANGEVGQAAGGARAGPDLSTPEAAKTYLISQGFDPSKFIFQVGLKNYAGPSCPGLGWNCTTANLVVQIASAGGENYAECAEDARQCVIVQGSQNVGPLPLSGENDINMHAHCGPPGSKRMMRKESDTLTCVIPQSNLTTGNNYAVVGMSIHDNDGSPQFGHTDAVVTQSTLGDGDNHAIVHEEIVLQTSDESTGTQKQDGFQSLQLTQTTETGDNFADVKQTQNITARAQSPATMQKQNTDEVSDPCVGPSTHANSCVRFDQSAGTGRSQITIHQNHNVEAVGAGGQQNQGCVSKECTLEVEGTQIPLGSTNTVDDNQSLTYTLRGPEGTKQVQDPVARNQGLQTGSPNDIWKVTQLAVIKSNDGDDEDDVQAQINEVHDTSDFGTVDARSVIILNDQRSEIVCNASSCNYDQVCGEVAGFEGDPEFFCPEFADRSPGVD